MELPDTAIELLPEVKPSDGLAGVSPDTIAVLRRMGYEIQPGNPPIIARVEAILMNDGWLQGAHDSRGAGKVAGN